MMLLAHYDVLVHMMALVIGLILGALATIAIVREL